MTTTPAGVIEVCLCEAGAGALLARWQPGLQAWRDAGWRVRIWATPQALAHLSQAQSQAVHLLEGLDEAGHDGVTIILSDQVFSHPLVSRALCWSSALRHPVGDWAPAWRTGLPDAGLSGMPEAILEYASFLDTARWQAENLAQHFREQVAGRGFGIYGRGMVGRTAMRMAAQCGLQASFWVDTQDPGDDAVQDGLPVYTPATAPDAPVIFAAGAADAMGRNWAQAGRGEGYGLSMLHLACAMPGQPEAGWREDVQRRRGAWLWLLGQLDGSASIKVSTGLLRFRRTLDDQALWAVKSPHEQWFDTDYFDAARVDSLVDCGAYDGDTARAFLRHVPHGKVVCIEPDGALAERARQDPLLLAAGGEVVQAAIGSHEGTAVFQKAEGMSGAVADTVTSTDDSVSETVAVTTVDKWLGARAAMLKIDVEGQESQALAGAISTIGHGAFVAMAAYHKAGDMVDLALMMSEMQGMALGLRHYTGLAFETVLYTTRLDPLSTGHK